VWKPWSNKLWTKVTNLCYKNSQKDLPHSLPPNKTQPNFFFKKEKKKKKKRKKTFQSYIVEKMNMFFGEMIHNTLRCTMHLHGHRNKNVPFMKPFILYNDAKFRSCTCWSINDTCNHCLSCWVNNHHIGNKNLVFTNHVEINL